MYNKRIEQAILASTGLLGLHVSIHFLFRTRVRTYMPRTLL